MTTVEIGGKSYPVRFTLGALTAMNDRYGADGASKLLENISGGEYRDMSWLICLLIQQGCRYAELMGLDGYEKVPPDPSTVEVLLDTAKMREVMGAVAAEMSSSGAQTVETVSKSKKK